MDEYRGTCHCGAIAFTFAAQNIAQAMRCNCSICRRHNALLSDFTLLKSALQIHATGGALRRYKFGSKTAMHHFCNVCGVFTFVETRMTPGEYRVNLGCVDTLNLAQLDVIEYDARNL
jgi:hypothetical protein